MGITMETRRNANTLGVSAAQRLAAASSARLPGINTGTRNGAVLAHTRPDPVEAWHLHNHLGVFRNTRRPADTVWGCQGSHCLSPAGRPSG